jgi:hypothetical protein
MTTQTQDYAPFFREGRLYLPQKTVTMLKQAGLDEEAAQSALRGLSLDDDRQLIGEISGTLETVLGKLAEQARAFQQLSSDTTQFFLTQTL